MMLHLKLVVQKYFYSFSLFIIIEEIRSVQFFNLLLNKNYTIIYK